jgi:hypothetical protein
LRRIPAHAVERERAFALPGNPVFSHLKGMAKRSHDFMGNVVAREHQPAAEVQACNVMIQLRTLHPGDGRAAKSQSFQPLEQWII